MRSTAYSSLVLAIGVLAVAPNFATPTNAQQSSSPPLVSQLNNGNWLPQHEAESLRDEMFYQRAVFAYQMTLPALNIIGIRDGSEATFGKGYNILPIWKDRMDARAWIPTPNADVIYSMSYLDLRFQQGCDQQRRLGRSVVWPDEASRRAGLELDPDGQRTKLSGGAPPLRHRGRVLRPDLEAGRCREGEVRRPAKSSTQGNTE